MLITEKMFILLDVVTELQKEIADKRGMGHPSSYDTSNAVMAVGVLLASQIYNASVRVAEKIK